MPTLNIYHYIPLYAKMNIILANSQIFELNSNKFQHKKPSIKYTQERSGTLRTLYENQFFFLDFLM